MLEFNNWIQKSNELPLLEYKEIEVFKQPKPGDLVLSQASAIFKPYQDSQGGWVQPKSRRDLFKSKTTTYIISGSPNENNYYPVFIFSSSGKRNKKILYINFEDLYNITSAYSPEEQQGRNIWLWLKPNMKNYTKHKNVYNQWFDPQKIIDNSFQSNPNQRFWKNNKDEKIYDSFPEE